MKKIALLVLLALCVMPAMLQAKPEASNKGPEVKKTQPVAPKLETKEVRPAFKAKSSEEAQAAFQKHREALVAQNKAFQQAMHEKQMGELKAKLAQNKKLTEEQKKEILATREKKYNENMAYAEQRRNENAAFFQKLSSDSKMTEEQKREAIRAHFMSQKPGNQVFRQQQKEDSKAESEKIRSGGASSAKTAAQ